MHIRVVSDHDAKLGMITIIGPGIILKGIDRAMADSTDRAPEEITEVDEQVWRDPVTFFVYFLRLLHPSTVVSSHCALPTFPTPLRDVAENPAVIAFQA